jgi:protein-tyrosine phosphatase
MRPGIDLHCHILPGVDDGPATLGESLRLGRLAAADGTGHVVATPHVSDVDPDTIPERVRELQASFDLDSVPVGLSPGGEVDLASAFDLGEATLAAIAQGPRRRRWILLEAPLRASPPSAVAEAVATLRSRGFGSVIAHPERSPMLMSDGAVALRQLVAAGARVQVSASSLVGAHGDATTKAALALLRWGIPHVIASDAHSAERPPRLREAARAVARAGMSAALIRRLFHDGPWKLAQAGVSSTGAWTPAAVAGPDAEGSPRASANCA